MTVLAFLKKMESDITDLFTRQTEVEKRVTDTVASVLADHTSSTSGNISELASKVDAVEQQGVLMEQRIASLFALLGDPSDGPSLDDTPPPPSAPAAVVDHSAALEAALATPPLGEASPKAPPAENSNSLWPQTVAS